MSHAPRKWFPVVLFLFALLIVSCAPAAPTAAPTAPAAAAPTAAPATAKVKVAILGAGPATVGSYEIVHHEAFLAMCSKYGFEGTTVDNLDYAKAAESMRSLASQGVSMVIANSSGYGDAMLQVAPEFPHTWFIMTSDLADTKGNKNVAVFEPRWPEAGYLVGVAAGAASKSGKIGVITAESIPSINRDIGGLINGAKSMNPNADVQVTYTQSWTDTSKAKEAATALVNGGRDVLAAMVGSAEPGVIQAAQDTKTLFVGYMADEYNTAPTVIFTSQVINMNKVYADVGDLFTSGKIEPKIYVKTVADGSITLAPMRGLVPKEVEDKVMAVLAKVKSGEIQVQEAEYKPK